MAAGLESMIVSTYQAVSGSGREGVDELADELEKHQDHDPRILAFNGAAFPLDEGVKFPATIAHNVIPIAGSIVDDGSLETNEEQKLRDESRKILEIPNLPVSATCVRVPVFSGHSLSLTAWFRVRSLARARHGDPSEVARRCGGQHAHSSTGDGARRLLRRENSSRRELQERTVAVRER